MKYVKVTVRFKVPKWNFCNQEGLFGTMPKELCRFCKKTKEGYYCALHDEWLSATRGAVHKASPCLDATVGYDVTVETDEPVVPQVTPQQIIADAVRQYDATRQQLLSQGYPPTLAESVARKMLIGK